MGRGIPSSRPGAHASLLWHREVNQQMLEEMWHSLVTLLHPTMHQLPPSLDELFELLKNATWHDFFQVFPYELREHATYLGHDVFHDELDALALLLAAPQSKQRFQRYFEQYAALITSTSAVRAGGSSGRRTSAAAAAGGTRRFRLGLPLLTAADAADDEDAGRAYDPQQRQLPHPQPQPRPQQEVPAAFHRGQLQQQQQPPPQPAQTSGAGPVAYVSPAAPGRLPTAAQPGWRHLHAAAGAARLVPQPAQQQQQQRSIAELFNRSALTGVGVTIDELARFAVNAAGPAGRGHAAAAPGAGGTAAAAAAGAYARLSGRRRTWLEACDADAPPAAAAAAAPGTAGTAAARAQSQQAAAAPPQAAAGAPAAAAAAGGVAAAATVNNSGVWRAVHAALTADDEGLLQCVSRLVPYSFAGQLRDAGETAAQLQALACSRPVPAKVVAGIAERLAASSGVQLLRVSASSGYSRRTAAAAAVLACPSRKPFYVSLAGCCSQDDVEAAVIRGVFAAQQQQQQTPDVQQQQQLQQALGWREQQERQQGQDQQALPDHQQQQQQQQQRAEAGRQQRMLLHSRGPAQPGRPHQQLSESQLLRGVQVRIPTAAAPAAAAARPRAEPATAAGSQHGWRLIDMDQLIWGPVPGAGGRVAAGAAEAAASPAELLEEYLTYSDSEEEHIEGDSDFGDTADDGDEEENGTDRCAEALAARLTLLGMCSEQPLLLMLDEADAATLQQGAGQRTGGLLTPMLLRLLRQLPQVVLLVTDSFEPDALADSNLLRRQGRPVVHCLPDGKLSITSYGISRAVYHYSCDF